MNLSRYQVSLGALALVLCLAFPMGVVSLLSPTTTGDQVDAAGTVAVVTIEAIQVVPDTGKTVLELAVDHHVAGVPAGAPLNLVVDGRPPLEVGDRIVAMLGAEPRTLLGSYLVQKNPATLAPELVTPVTGMWTEGLSEYPPVDLGLFETAVRVRRGMIDPSLLGKALAGGNGDINAVGAPVDPDNYEPNDTIQEGTVVILDPPKLITGMPLCITGLTLTENDVDFWGFNGAGLSILHAETRLPEGITNVNVDLDTLVGLFDNGSGDLLAFDDDSGQGKLSRLIAPIPSDGFYSVAVESAPDTDLSFTGDEGLTTGPYELKLELERASFLTNFTELVVGVSPDGTFIEDFIGFREVGGPDVLLNGAATDGWGLTYQSLIPGGLTEVNQGAGSHQGDPGFDEGLPLIPGAFVLGPFVDGAGYNRAGFAKSSSLVPYQLMPRRGVQVTTEYTLSLDARTLNGTIELKAATNARVLDLTFSRVMDVDLFGSSDPGSTSDDHFFWSFDANGTVKAYAVDAGENVSTIVEPGATTSDATGDFQAALVIENGDVGGGGGFQETMTYGSAFTLVSGFLDEDSAKSEAEAQLTDAGMEAWVIAVDEDPANPGLFTAFGAGLAGPLN
jgi:hypothetical protein